MTASETREFLAPPLTEGWAVLPQVSRTFALTIPLLEDPLRTEIALSYLLCRIADTIEDREDLDPGQRFILFRLFLDQIASPRDLQARRRFLERWPPVPDPHHERLVRGLGELLDAYLTLPEGIRGDIASCLDEMVGGMAGFPSSGDPTRPVEACADLSDLESYCHFVAGTVGILLSQLFARELPPGWLSAKRLEDGRRFGLGLQLTNVLKDHAADRRRGITYVPRAWLEPGRRNPSVAGVRTVVRRALAHLDAAHAYVLSIPPARADLRRFCLGASHLALATLRLLAAAQGRQPAKVGRDEVGLILDWLREEAEDDEALTRAHERRREAVVQALGAGAPAGGEG